ncbi:MAG: ferritin-like domain-containing protein [Chloroherpetonaceae bacterium]|nr:ferritin-like domain-containing protein [Chthonomonadaceae bacterium]MDW8207588.1 ferritin-like domain-containing protein [Chloroherpetonaceae bacterium]
MSKEVLIEALNDQLAAEYQAMIMYLHYAAVVTGPHRPELVGFFQPEVAGEQVHAQYLAEKISALGGIPTTTPKPVPHSTDARQLLEYVLEAEKKAIAAYTRIIQLADEAGEIGIRVQIENFLQDETHHRDETQKILEGWRD